MLEGLSRRRRRAAPHVGSVFFEVRFRGRGVAGCVLLSQIYKMFRRAYAGNLQKRQIYARRFPHTPISNLVRGSDSYIGYI